MNFATLPNLVALAVLVGVFWAISRKATNERLHLWLTGWVLVLLHFVAQFADTGKGPWGRTTAIVSLNSLVLAGIAFLISVSPSASTKLRQKWLGLCLGIPAVLYATGVACDVTSRSFYYLVVVAGLLLRLATVWRHSGSRAGRKALVAAGWSALGIAALLVVHQSSELGIIAILAGVNFAVAFFYWVRHRRRTAGVLTAMGGFVLWGAVFPVAPLLERFLPSVKVASEVWNIPKYLVAVGMILTLLEDQIETSNYFAFHDELTGLPNRRLLQDRLTQALAIADRNGTKVAVLLLDLNRFKEVNDTYGHRVGDLALREVVARLARCVHPGDTLARSGGDEFTIVSHIVDVGEAVALQSALESALSAPIDIEGTEVQTGLSIGLALYPDDGSDPDRLCAAADHEMYAVKRALHSALSGEAVPQTSVGELPVNVELYK